MKYKVDYMKKVCYWDIGVEADSESEAKDKVLKLIKNEDIGIDYINTDITATEIEE